MNSITTPSGSSAQNTSMTEPPSATRAGGV